MKTKEFYSYCKEELGYTPIFKVAAIINGKLMYLSEPQVRYLQVKCSQCETEEEYETFKKNHIIYSGRTKRKSKHIMIFRRDGKFFNEFENGFFSLNADLAFKII
jgi:hypothetical protein